MEVELDPRIKEKIDKFNSLPKEAKVKVIKSILDYFVKLSEKENKIIAWAKFNEWLASEDGAIVFPHIFKEEYRDLIIDITYYYLLITSKIVLKLLKP